MMAGKKLTPECELVIRKAKAQAFANRTKANWLNCQRLRLKAKCLCSGREELEAFSHKHARVCLAEARGIMGTVKMAGWAEEGWHESALDTFRAQALIRKGIRAYWNCDEDGRKELGEMVVGTINRLIARLHHEDIEIGKMLGVLRIKSRAFEEAEEWAARLAGFGYDAKSAIYEVYESCLEYNRALDANLRMELRETAIRIAPDREEREKQLRKFQEECAGGM